MSPIRSMTGFGRSEVTTPLGVFCVEIKAVNTVFWMPAFTCSGSFPPSRFRCSRRSRTGSGGASLRVLVRWTPAGGTAFLQRFNRPALEIYQRDLREMAQSLGHADGPSFEFLLGLPGVAEKGILSLRQSGTLSRPSRPSTRRSTNCWPSVCRKAAPSSSEFLERIEALERLRLRVEERQPEVTEAVYRARLDKRAEEWAKWPRSNSTRSGSRRRS